MESSGTTSLMQGLMQGLQQGLKQGLKMDNLRMNGLRMESLGMKSLRMNSLRRRIYSIVTLSALMFGVFLPAAADAAGGAAVLSTETLTRGVKLEKWVYPTSAGTAKISVIEVDLKDPYVVVDTVFGKDGKTGAKHQRGLLYHDCRRSPLWCYDSKRRAD